MTDRRTPETAPLDEPIRDDELVAADDTIIGKAFVWSLLVFLVIGGFIGAMVLLMQGDPPPVVKEAPTYVPPRTVQTTVEPVAAPFTDITASAGITFVHENGATGDKLLPETMGGGCAFLDYDNDGDQDILLINSKSWSDAASPSTHGLYRNDGNGHFADVTSIAGLNIASYGMGVAVGDYDNDGFVDIYITNLGSNQLLHNNGDGTFSDVTSQTQVAGGENDWSTSAGFIDYNNDGLLDLFVCNYVKWSREIDFAVNYTLVGLGRAYGPPNNFEGSHNYLYKNNGDGTFSDVSESAGIQIKGIQGQPMGKALGVTFADIDRDGWFDIFVANDTVQRFLFHNQRDGTFKERAAEFGLAFDRNGNATGAMGTDNAHFRNDDSLGIVIGNFANEMSSLLVSQNQSTQFSDEAITEGIGSPTRLRLTFGAFFFDYDLDGRLDLLHANGHIEDQINTVQPSQRYEQSAQLFWNAGAPSRTCFIETPTSLVGDMAKPIVGRGAAYADIDNDGDLDVLLTSIKGPPLLLRNDQQVNHNWLRLKLSGNGTTVNRDAIGTQVEVIVGEHHQIQTVMPARSYLSQVELPITFGLGDGAETPLVKITWPDGSTQEMRADRIDAVLKISQSSERSH